MHMQVNTNSDDDNPVIELPSADYRRKNRWQIGIDSVAVTGTVTLEGMPRSSAEYKTLAAFDLADATKRFMIVDGIYDRFRADHSGLAADTDYTLHLDPLA